jgi:hypothetical protein
MFTYYRKYIGVEFMPIPNNISREHIFQAMLRVRNLGVPVHRDPERWVLKYEEFEYPCKLLISWGNLFANGFELDPNPDNFTTQSAQRYLRNLGLNNIVDLHRIG